MKTLDCCLTLTLPKSLEETIVGHLLAHPEWVLGFNTADVSGHGAAGVAHTAAELVRGATRRVRVQIVMNREDAAAHLVNIARPSHSCHGGGRLVLALQTTTL